MHEIRVGQNDGGQRLDKFLQKALPALPPSLLYKSIRTKKIKVNRRRAEGSQILREGDTLQLFLSEEFFAPQSDAAVTVASLSRRRVSPDVVYEDENILLLHKHPGLSVHEDETGSGRNLLTDLQEYLYQNTTPTANSPSRPPCATVSTATPTASSSPPRRLKPSASSMKRSACARSTKSISASYMVAPKCRT